MTTPQEGARALVDEVTQSALDVVRVVAIERGIHLEPEMLALMAVGVNAGFVATLLAVRRRGWISASPDQ